MLQEVKVRVTKQQKNSNLWLLLHNNRCWKDKVVIRKMFSVAVADAVTNLWQYTYSENCKNLKCLSQSFQSYQRYLFRAMVTIHCPTRGYDVTGPTSVALSQLSGICCHSGEPD